MVPIRASNGRSTSNITPTNATEQPSDEDISRASGSSYRNYPRKNAPGRHIIERRSSNGHGSHRSASESSVLEYSHQHRERRYGHCHADEEHERKSVHIGSKSGVKPERQNRAQSEWDDQRAKFHCGNGAPPTTKKPGVEFNSNQEHEEQQADLGNRS